MGLPKATGRGNNNSTWFPSLLPDHKENLQD